MELSGYYDRSSLDRNWQFATLLDLIYLLRIIYMYIIRYMLPLVLVVDRFNFLYSFMKAILQLCIEISSRYFRTIPNPLLTLDTS